MDVFLSGASSHGIMASFSIKFSSIASSINDLHPHDLVAFVSLSRTAPIIVRFVEELS